MRCLLAALLLAVMATARPAHADATLRDTGRLVVIEVDTPRFELLGDGRLVNPSTLARPGEVALNFMFFNTYSGCPAGLVRRSGTTIFDDSRRFGWGVTWENDAWDLVPADRASRAANGALLGPRLLQGGRVVLDPEGEQVSPEPYARARRVALGRRAGNTVIVASREPLTLRQFARRMRAMGLEEAINLDGGTSACLYWDGRPIVRPGRSLPYMLSFPIRTTRPADTVDSPTLLRVPLTPDLEGSVLMLDPAVPVKEAVAKADVDLAFSPGLFDSKGLRLQGHLLSEGRLLQTHRGPHVGWTWSLGADNHLEVGPCVAALPPSGRLGTCGPLVVDNARGVSPDSQGYRLVGGPDARHARIAVGVETSGETAVLAYKAPLTYREWQAALSQHARTAVYLEGGECTALFASGTWYIEPRQPVPYLFVFRRPRAQHAEAPSRREPDASASGAVVAIRPLSANTAAWRQRQSADLARMPRHVALGMLLAGALMIFNLSLLRMAAD